MKIGIDARLIDETGVGRYIRNLIGELAKQDKRNEYVVFCLRNISPDLCCPPRWSKVGADVHWHTIAEQIRMPGIFRAAKPTSTFLS